MSFAQMSLSGAVMIGVVVAVRALGIHRLPKITFLTLWSVVLFRLLVPFSIPSAFNAFSLAASVPARAGLPLVDPSDLTQHFPLVTGDVSSHPPFLTTAGQPFPFITVIWMIGALLCAGYFGSSYVKCRFEFRASLPVRNPLVERWLRENRSLRPIQVRQYDRITTPLTFGVWRPVILMPKDLDWTDQALVETILTHEYVHVVRCDALAKLILIVVACLHWFNPFVWIMFVLANRDIELSCDETVIRLLGNKSRSAYAMALIRMEEMKNGLAPLCSSFSKNAVEERITAIVKYPKTSPACILIGLALILGSTTLFATTPLPAETPAIVLPGIATNLFEKYRPETTLPTPALPQIDDGAGGYPALVERASEPQIIQTNEFVLVIADETSILLSSDEKPIEYSDTVADGRVTWHIDIGASQ